MSYTVIKADLNKNKNDIRAIWERNYPGALEKKFEWIYESNPAGRSHVWLVRHEDSGEYVGATSLFPREFVINGKTYIAGIAGDLIVNKEHRSLGPAMMLQKAVLSAVKDGTFNFIYGFPNNASEPVFKRVGYQLLGERARLVKILKTAPRISRLPFGRYWGFLVSPVLDLILRLLSFETWHFNDKNFICEEVEDFDERFDLLWENRNFQWDIIGERKTDYLKWKFIQAPHGKNKIMVALDASRRNVKGYIVYRLVEQSLEIRDISFAPDKKASSALMVSFLRHARESGVNSVVIALLENNKVIGRMRHFGFVERKDGQNVFLFYSKETLSAYPFLQNRDNWLLLQSDDDM